MRVYRTRASDWFEDRPMMEGRTVYEDRDWRNTRLLDASGAKLYARDHMDQIGFVVFDEPGVKS